MLSNNIYDEQYYYTITPPSSILSSCETVKVLVSLIDEKFFNLYWVWVMSGEVILRFVSDTFCI